MKTLFIDSSKKRLSVALANSNELLFVSNVDSYSRHSNFLMKEIINVLNKTNFTIYDVDNIVVLNGPGSFTGVRVGVTIAKTLAWVLSKKIYSLTTLEALALQDSDNSNIICSIFDKPKAGYLGIYLDDYKDENYYTIEEASKLVTNKEVTIVCLEEDDFTMNLYKELQNKNIVTLKVIDNYDYLKVINKALLTPSLNPHSVKPIYLKKIDVEKKEILMVRDYNPNDKETIIKLGSKLHKQYKFNLDLFSKCKVLQIGDNIVGFVTYSVIYERAELIDIIIDEQFRKRGYGSKLLKSVIDDAILQNCDNITLEVREDNYSAINLYKRYNFEVVAVRKNYYKDKDAYLMKLSLEVTK